MQGSNSSSYRSHRRASDTLVAPRSYKPILEDYDPLRRKSDTLELPPTIAEELRGSRSSICSSIGSHGSGDTLILPAITVPRAGGEGNKSGRSTNSKPRTISLPAVTVTADPESTSDQDSCISHRPSFYAPASKVKYALMVRGRRNSSACVASTVFEHPLVSVWLQIFTARVRRMREGNVFTGVCLLTDGEGYLLVSGPRSFLGRGTPWPLVPGPFWGMGYPLVLLLVLSTVLFHVMLGEGRGIPVIARGTPSPPRQDKGTHLPPHHLHPGQERVLALCGGRYAFAVT